MTQSNFEKFSSHPKYKIFLYIEIFNLTFQSFVLAGSIRHDSATNPLGISSVTDIINNIINILRKAIEDAFRSSFGGGGENAYDIPLQISPAFLSIFLISKKDEENSLKFNSRRVAKILAGISVVIAAFFVNGWLKDLHKALSQNQNIPKFVLVLLQGFTGTLFSFMFVFGMLAFAISMGTIIGDISKKLEKKSDGSDRTHGKSLNKTFLWAGFIGISVIMPAGLLLLSKKLANLASDLAEKSPKLAMFYNFLATSLIVLAILFGISVLGRRFLEALLKDKIIKALPSYNSLLGEKGADDKFTNDAINDNCQVTYGYVDGKLVYIAIPNGYELKKNGKNFDRNLIKISDGSGKNEENAYDSEGNFYEVVKSKKKKNHRNRSIAKLIGYALAWYVGLFLCYGVVFCCGEFLETVLINTLKDFNLPEWIGVIGNDLINNIFYLAAILIGMQAIGCLLKVVNIISFDKNFAQDIKTKSKDEVKSIHSKNEYKIYGLVGALAIDTGLMIGLVVLLAEKKIELSFAVPLLILAFLTIGRVCMAFMTQAIGQNITIEESREDLFPKKQEEAVTVIA